MEGCLENSEKLLPYEALLENIAHIVYRLDLISGRFEYISGAAAKLFGLELDAIREAGADLVGSHMLPGDYESALARIREAAAGMARASDDLNAFLDQRLADEGLSPARLILFGFSQGTMMSLHVAPRRPEAVAGIVAFSGRLLNPDALAAETLSRPPVLLLHGDADPMVPFAEMNLAGRALGDAGFEVYGHVMKGTGHGIAPDGLSVALAFIRDRLGKS